MASRPNISINRGGSPLAIPAALASVMLGFVLLAAANSTGNYFDLDDAQMVVGGTFLLLIFALTLTSLSRNMQVCFQIAYIYFAIYLLLPGFNHVSINQYPFFSMSYSMETRLAGAIIVSLFCCMLVMVQLAGYLFWRSPPIPAAVEETSAAANPLFLVLFWVVLAISLGLFLSLLGTNFAFGARGEKIEMDAASGAIASSLPRAIAAVGMAYALAQIRLLRLGPAIIVFILFVIPTLILLYPPAIPRSQLFGLLLICAFAIFNFSRVAVRLGLSMLFIFGAVIAMPIADMLTRGRQSLSDIYLPEVFSHYFESGDFDGLQSLNNVTIFSQVAGLQYGKQLLGSLLFFIPREIWPSKAEPTGLIAARVSGYKFLNVSEPLPGEFYADFGLWGVAIGGIIIALLFLRLDRWIDRNWPHSPEARLIAGTFVAYSIAVFRGTLAGVIGPVFLVAVLSILIKWWGFRRVPNYNIAPLPPPDS